MQESGWLEAFDHFHWWLLRSGALPVLKNKKEKKEERNISYGVKN
jgi:hypothetical protein